MTSVWKKSAQSLLAVAAVAASALFAPAAGHAAPSCSPVAPTEAAAAAAAKACGITVEALDHRSATSSLQVQADGTAVLYVSTYAWTQVSSGYPTTSFWTTNRDAMRSGREYGTTRVWRSFVRFDGLAPVTGTQILNATVTLTLNHSASCAATPVDLWKTQDLTAPATTTWANSLGYWQTKVASVSTAANTTCGSAPHAVTFSGGVTNAVQQKAAGGGADITFGLRALDENDQLQWKKFAPTGAFLEIWYQTA
ncbi:DNRLRE domain-containing protein [Dactylosporangium sp. CA-152071]|uniref:DNRLRE domain-containing protein n=1 Tax=Dactylosporangium sp. CA-152071 TaxID=3239933 RepID=UPI003D8F24C5